MATTTSPALRHGLHFYDAIHGHRADRASNSAPKIWLLIPKGKTVISACERDGSRNGRQGHNRVSVSAPLVAIVPEYARITFDSNDEMPPCSRKAACLSPMSPREPASRHSNTSPKCFVEIPVRRRVRFG